MMSRRAAIALVVKAVYWRIRHWWATPMPDRREPPLRPNAFVMSMYTGSVRTAMGLFRADVFPYRSRDAGMFSIETEDKRAQVICNSVIDPRYEREVLGDIGDLADFLRDAVQELQVRGIYHARIEWRSVSRGRGKSIVLPEFHPLQSDGVKQMCSGSEVPGYEISPLLAFPWKRAFRRMRLPGQEEDERPFRVGVDEMLALIAEGLRPGHVPLANFVNDYWRHWVAMDAKVASFSPPTVRGLRVEAARHRDQQQLLREAQLSDMRMQDRAGASLLVLAAGYPNLVQPVSDYFLAWQHKETRKRAARWREAILREFSRQVLEPMLARNGIEAAVSMKAVGLKDESEFDPLFHRFLSERLSLEDFWRLCRDDEQVAELR